MRLVTVRVGSVSVSAELSTDVDLLNPDVKTQIELLLKLAQNANYGRESDSKSGSWLEVSKAALSAMSHDLSKALDDKDWERVFVTWRNLERVLAN